MHNAENLKNDMRNIICNPIEDDSTKNNFISNHELQPNVISSICLFSANLSNEDTTHLLQNFFQTKFKDQIFVPLIKKFQTYWGKKKTHRDSLFLKNNNFTISSLFEFGDDNNDSDDNFDYDSDNDSIKIKHDWNNFREIKKKFEFDSNVETLNFMFECASLKSLNTSGPYKDLILNTTEKLGKKMNFFSDYLKEDFNINQSLIEISEFIKSNAKNDKIIELGEQTMIEFNYLYNLKLPEEKRVESMSKLNNTLIECSNLCENIEIKHKKEEEEEEVGSNNVNNNNNYFLHLYSDFKEYENDIKNNKVIETNEIIFYDKKLGNLKTKLNFCKSK